MTPISIVSALLILISDTFIKHRIDNSNAPDKKYCKGHIIITKLHNRGIMLGGLSSKPAAMKLVTTAAMIMIHLFYIPLLFKKGFSLEKLGFGMIIGGAWSNFLDHWIKGYVVDYIRIPHSFIKRIVFNISDLFIALGAIFITIAQFFK